MQGIPYATFQTTVPNSHVRLGERCPPSTWRAWGKIADVTHK